jgi:hypothetical protein
MSTEPLKYLAFVFLLPAHFLSASTTTRHAPPLRSVRIPTVQTARHCFPQFGSRATAPTNFGNPRRQRVRSRRVKWNRSDEGLQGHGCGSESFHRPDLQTGGVLFAESTNGSSVTGHTLTRGDFPCSPRCILNRQRDIGDRLDTVHWRAQCFNSRRAAAFTNASPSPSACRYWRGRLRQKTELRI